MIVKEEYYLLEEIRSMWGLDIETFGKIAAQFNAEPSNIRNEMEENTGKRQNV